MPISWLVRINLIWDKIIKPKFYKFIYIYFNGGTIPVKTYKVLLHRDYVVNIDANNEDDARSLVEFFIAGEKDSSTEKEREKHSFKINEIEMMTHDAFEVIYR
jgi:hypothetical protein